MSREPAAQLQHWAMRCEATLDRWLPPIDGPVARLAAAMRHCSLGGGKRMRPCLLYASGCALGLSESALDHAAAAVELIHVYSLVHDDLPAMDDDDLRRGKPTVHVAFDEATAILTGDALQSLAFELLADAPIEADRRVRMLRCLANASGIAGMCGGQAIDVGAIGRTLNEDELRVMHARKTGALIDAAVALGALAAGAEQPLLDRLRDFSAALGLAFQIKDDLLDVEADSAALGKTAGKDAAQGKPTYVQLFGLAGARQRLAEQSERMQSALAELPFDCRQLSHLAVLAASRAN